MGHDHSSSNDGMHDLDLQTLLDGAVVDTDEVSTLNGLPTSPSRPTVGHTPGKFEVTFREELMLLEQSTLSDGILAVQPVERIFELVVTRLVHS